MTQCLTLEGMHRRQAAVQRVAMPVPRDIRSFTRSPVTQARAARGPQHLELQLLQRRALALPHNAVQAHAQPQAVQQCRHSELRLKQRGPLVLPQSAVQAHTRPGTVSGLRHPELQLLQQEEAGLQQNGEQEQARAKPQAFQWLGHMQRGAPALLQAVEQARGGP